MKRGITWVRSSKWVLWLSLAFAGVCALMLYKLGTLTGGMSAGEVVVANKPLGWNDLFNNPLYLPLDSLRSLIFFLAPDHGQLLTRLPNAIFGALSIFTFAWLIWLWHGTRTAIFAGALFATAAWTLHVSRLASYDVLYLWAIPALLVAQVLVHRQGQRAVVWYGNILLLGVLLYIPGLVWLVLLNLFFQRNLLIKAWKQFSSGWRKLFTILVAILPLPLLIYGLTKPGQLAQWLGAPSDWESPLTILKNFGEIFLNLFITGPNQSVLWLGRAPIMDIFTMVVCAVGIYFYAKHVSATRSRTLGLMFACGVILLAINGPVQLSLLVPMLYIAAAAGIAYLLHDWLKVFPLNPLARGLGIGLISVAVLASCAYNLRSYFVVWPHNKATQKTFNHHL